MGGGLCSANDDLIFYDGLVIFPVVNVIEKNRIIFNRSQNIQKKIASKYSLIRFSYAYGENKLAISRFHVCEE